MVFYARGCETVSFFFAFLVFSSFPLGMKRISRIVCISYHMNIKNAHNCGASGSLALFHVHNTREVYGLCHGRPMRSHVLFWFVWGCFLTVEGPPVRMLSVRGTVIDGLSLSRGRQTTAP